MRCRCWMGYCIQVGQRLPQPALPISSAWAQLLIVLGLPLDLRSMCSVDTYFATPVVCQTGRQGCAANWARTVVRARAPQALAIIRLGARLGDRLSSHRPDINGWHWPLPNIGTRETNGHPCVARAGATQTCIHAAMNCYHGAFERMLFSVPARQGGRRTSQVPSRPCCPHPKRRCKSSDVFSAPQSCMPAA